MLPLLRAAAVVIASAFPAAADSLNSIATGDPYFPPPLGWTLFCREHPAWCAGLPATAPLKQTPALMALLKRVNAAVNRAIAYKPESRREIPVLNRPGKTVPAESWDIEPRSGDCEDYSVTKAARLMAAGLPRSALLVAIYRLPNGVYHAVLTVETDGGTLVLSNLTDRVMPWREVPGARWILREGVSRYGFMSVWGLR